MSWDVLITLLGCSVRSRASFKGVKVFECDSTGNFVASENCCFSEMNEDSNVGRYGRHILNHGRGNSSRSSGAAENIGDMYCRLLLNRMSWLMETVAKCQTARLLLPFQTETLIIPYGASLTPIANFGR